MTRRVLAALLLACCCILPVAAQDDADEADREAQLEQLRERLQEARDRLALTDQQREQVRPILAAGTGFVAGPGLAYKAR